MDESHLTADALCDFAEGLMTPADRRAADAHLADCSECRREAAAMQVYFREMSGLETLKAPDRFLTKVHARIAKASPWRRLLAALSSPRLLPAPLMGLAVVLVGVYFFFLSPRLAEQTLSETQAAPADPATPASDPTVQLAKKSKAAPAEKSPQTGSSADDPAEPPAQVAMAPSKPVAEAKQRTPSISQANRSDRAARKGAPARPKQDVAVTEIAPVETGTLAMAKASAERPGQDDLLKDAPHAPPAGAPAAKAEAAPVDKASTPEAASAARIPEPVAVAAGDSRDRQLSNLELDEGAGYSEAAPTHPKRRASAAAAPPAVTPKPWAPLGYTLKSKIGEASLRGGLTKLGVKVLRHDEDHGRSYELEIPATRVIDLEAYLGGLGSLTPSPQPLPGNKSGAPIRLTLQVLAP